MLFIVGTPIGNLQDITLRALETLKNVDLILAEDTRRTSILLKHFEISKPVESFNEHNSKKKMNYVLKQLKEGKNIALVSDAGMQTISDPGANLIESCYENGIDIDVVPGPSALTSAIALSGFRGTEIYFVGFIPRDKYRRRLLRKLKDDELIDTVVFFESPLRLQKTLQEAFDILGDVEVFIAREMTKMHQEFLKGKISEILPKLGQIKGELTIVMKTKEGQRNESRDGDI